MAVTLSSTGKCHLGCAHDLQGFCHAGSAKSLRWQGNIAKHLKCMHLRKVGRPKIDTILPIQAMRIDSKGFGIEKEKLLRSRCEVSRVDGSTLSLDVWSGRRTTEFFSPQEGNEPLSILGNEIAKEENHALEEASSLIATVSVTTASTYDAAQSKLSNQNHMQDSKDLLEFAQLNGRNATELEKKHKNVWQILQNDLVVVKNALEGLNKDLSSLSETVEKVITLRLWENPSATQDIELPRPQPYRPGINGLDLAVADFIAVKSYLHIAFGWFQAFQVSLQPCYDPQLIAAYFSRRPHILLFRILQVSAVFASAIFQLEAEKFFKSAEFTESEIQRRGAELVKGALISLGPTFIKVGQSLSTRADLIGTIPAKVFSKMQDDLPPFSTGEALSIIEEELGGPISTIFPDFSELPVASASFGQVYKARTIDGQYVAVKVQRPNLLFSIALDIYILRMGLDVLRKVAKRRSDLKLYADELGRGFFGELDYIQEANNAMEFKEAHSKLTFVDVPETLRDLSTRRVLTMKWVEGDRPNDLVGLAEMSNLEGDADVRERQLKAKQRLLSMVNKGVEASLVQLFDTGILHADPHPGNMLYTSDEKMVFLDFGLLCRMKRQHQLAMMASVTHIVNADWDSFVQDLAAMDVLPAYVNRKEITQELTQCLGDTVPQAGIPDIKFSKVLARVLAIALRYQFRMPPYFILVLRSIGSLEGLALAVDPDFQVFASSYPYVLQKLLTDDSVQLKRVLSNLILDKKNQFRWDRLASFATMARQYSQKRMALEAGIDLKLVSVSNQDTLNSELIPLLANLLLSEKGTIFRQLILESDTFDLARMFNSRKAAPLRRKLAKAMANAFYQTGQGFFKEKAHINLQLPGSSNAPSLSAENRANVTLLVDWKSLTDCSDMLDMSLLRNGNGQFLLQMAISRLRRRPVLLARTAWTSFTIFFYALALAAHRLVAALSFKMLDFSSKLLPSSRYQLSPL